MNDNSNNVHFFGVRFICSPYLAIKSALASLGLIMARCGPQMNLTPSKWTLWLYYEVTHAILQDIEKKNENSRVFCLICLKFCRLMEVNNGSLLVISNFVAMATPTKIISLFSKTKTIFSHNKRSVSPIFLRNMTLPAVTIKLFFFQITF